MTFVSLAGASLSCGCDEPRYARINVTHTPLPHAAPTLNYSCLDAGRATGDPFIYSLFLAVWQRGTAVTAKQDGARSAGLQATDVETNPKNGV